VCRFLGDKELIQNVPLLAMVYDRPGKGNDLVIETGKDEVTYAHKLGNTFNNRHTNLCWHLHPQAAFI
jgi:hypothetical protein